MNITFLIGNGFDLNLGLKTTYHDFIQSYIKLCPKDEGLNKFYNHISNNLKLWSNAELAFGQYTANLGSGQAEIFNDNLVDFITHLETYLKEEECKVDYDSFKKQIIDTFSGIDKVDESFPKEEASIIKSVFNSNICQQVVVKLICFNYTRTLDKCVEIARSKPDLLRPHYYNYNTYAHYIGDICHIHGTLNQNNMILGLNDETQIANLDIFQCDDGIIYKNSAIKKQANMLLGEGTDKQALNWIDHSNIIYIYGMSIGVTDKLWWSRIISWLTGNPENQLIIYVHDLSVKKQDLAKYKIAQNKVKSDFLHHGNLEREKLHCLEGQIHITDENIFEGICNIVKYN